MKKIKGDIYFENGYAGVTVGALLLSEGTILVDAPLLPEEGRDWLASLKKAGAKGRRILVNLDSHPDRTLGAQTLESEIIAHEETAEQFHRRAAIFKAVKQESGAEWERLGGLTGLHWVMPHLVFSDKAELRLGDQEVIVEGHAGPSPGASWLIVPQAKVVFVGDTITPKQPPFLALADIPKWVESLDVLLSKDYKGYRIFCGRGGEVRSAAIRTQRRFLKDVEGRLKRMAKRKAAVNEADKLVPKLLSKYKFPTKSKVMHSQRLKHGLEGYYSRHYMRSS